MNTLIDRLLHHAEQTQESCAVVSGQFVWSYAELAARVLVQSNHLEALGVTEASVVGIECDDDVLHLVLCLATVHLGATSCTLATFDSPEASERTIEGAGVSIVIDKDRALDLSTSLSSEASHARPLRSTAAAKLLFSTSGTTGEPKVVVHSDSSLVSQAHRHILSTSERFACLASMEHNFSKRHRLYCVAEGATNVFLDPSTDDLVEQCQSLNVTTLHVSAFQAQELLAIPNVGELSQLRLKLGGSHVTDDLRQALRTRITSELHCGYGTTETGAIAFTDPNDLNSEESVGRVLPGIEIRVMNSERNTVSTGERGDIAIRCEGMFSGYQNQPELSAKCLIDGWFFTGDVGYLDSEQRLRLCGRSDDMFVFNSLNIYPQDIEAQLRLHPLVVDVAVLPKPSPVHGDIPIALVVLENTESSDLGDLKKFARSQLGLRAPKQYTSVEQIPRNSAGKILRDAAQALLLEAGRR